MKKGLLVVERLVLESLSQKEKSLEELESDTDLYPSLLHNIVRTLEMRNIIVRNRGRYCLNKQNMKWIKEVNSHVAVKEEVKELFTSLVNHYYTESEGYEKGLKVQKVYMTESDEKIFNSLLYNLETFIKGVRSNQKKTCRTCEQKVVMWGHSSYSGLLNTMVGARC